MNSTTDSTQIRYLKLTEVCTLYGVGKTWIYDSIKAGDFPAPKKLGCMSRWSSDDLLKWEIDNDLRDKVTEPVENQTMRHTLF